MGLGRELCDGPPGRQRGAWPLSGAEWRKKTPASLFCHSLGLLLVAAIGQTQPEGRVQGPLKWISVTGAEQGAEGWGGIWRQTEDVQDSG